LGFVANYPWGEVELDRDEIREALFDIGYDWDDIENPDDYDFIVDNERENIKKYHREHLYEAHKCAQNPSAYYGLSRKNYH
jgi:hypothetical protein